LWYTKKRTNDIILKHNNERWAKIYINYLRLLEKSLTGMNRVTKPIIATTTTTTTTIATSTATTAITTTITITTTATSTATTALFTTTTTTSTST